MASLIFSHAKSIVKKCKQVASEQTNIGESDKYLEIYERELEGEMANFDEYLRVANLLHKRYESFSVKSKQGYFITIRPDCKMVTFDDFKTQVENFVQRKCFLEWTYSFEQKGTTPSDMGTGFHVHIVCKSKHRSKGECLRDTLSSWNEWIQKGYIASNCIEVVVTKNAESLIENYLVEYKSDDDHKIVTKSMDELWRNEMNLESLYKS